jgi:hypothetical protein
MSCVRSVLAKPFRNDRNRSPIATTPVAGSDYRALLGTIRLGRSCRYPGKPAIAGLEDISVGRSTEAGGKRMAECTVCGKELDADQMSEQREENGETVYLCCPQCQEEYSG